ncbi:MAG: hypothetical protein ACO1SV_12560 [Fimbriimonas sp.]
MDDRSRRFAIGVGVAWLILPLFGGFAGLGAAFAGLVLPYIEGDYAQLVGCGVVGCFAGAALATVHTVWSYWKTFLR